MTATSSDPETPATDAGPDETRRFRSQQNPRQKRSRRRLSLLWTIRRRLDQMLQTRQIIRTGFVWLPLAGFIYVSLMNGVGGPDETASDSITSARSTNNSDGLAGSDAGMLEPVLHNPAPSDNRAADVSSNVRSVVPVSQPASAWSIGDPGVAGTLSDGVDSALADRTDDKPMISDTAANGRSLEETNIYVVNEGGSLWRTGRRFIDDEILLDKLIDNLAESGMNVRSVRPGVEFIVNDLATEGLSVVVEDDGITYESRILGDSVTTSMLR